MSVFYLILIPLLVFVDGREFGFSFDAAFALRRARDVVVEELEGEQRPVLLFRRKFVVGVQDVRDCVLEGFDAVLPLNLLFLVNFDEAVDFSGSCEAGRVVLSI